MNDKLQQLYNLYKESGLISIDFNTFASADDNQRKGLYDLGVQQGLFSTTPYDTFSSAFSGGQPEQQYNKFDYKAVPEQPARTVERELMSGLENVVPGFEQSMQQKERVIEEGRVKKKEASALDLSAQQSLVESTAKQQEEASLLASQQYETAAEKLPILRNELFKDVYQQLQKEQNLPSFVKDQLENITPDFIGYGEFGAEQPFKPIGMKRDGTPNPFEGTSRGVAGLSVEEAVVPKMNYMFGPLGFAFEATGATGDYMIVTAPDKSKIEISLNNFTQSGNTEEAKKLKDFIASNSTKIPQIENYAAKYAGSNAKISSEKDVDNAISKVNNEYNTLNAEAETLSKYINVFENEANALNSTPEALRSTPEYIEKKKNLDATLLDINKRRQDIISKNSQIQASKAVIEKSVGKYSQMKAEQGTWTGATYSWFGEGTSTALTGLLGVSSDILTLGGNFFLNPNYTEEMYRKDKKETLSNIREGIKGAISDPNTSVEWKQLAEESFWGGAYAGLIKSAPAMLMPGGWAGRTAAFFGQSTDAVNQEMDKNPAFDNVSTSERLLVSVPIGIANAVLEEVGLSNMIKNKGFINSLVVKGLQKAGVNATETTLSKIIKNDVESMLARGTLTLAGAGLAEAETGSLQQIGEYAVKDIYNMAKEKKMFNTPDSLKEYVYDVVRAGAQEAVGGFIMGTPAAAAAAYRKQGFKGMSDDEFKTFEAIANDDKMQSSFIATLKTKVAAGDLTMEAAKEELNDYRKSVGLYRSIPTDLNIEAKKEAMNLVREKQVIEERIKEKDEALVKKQKDRIAEINNKLNTLSENAVQEQTTSEVPIQSEAGVGEEVEGGKPQAEPQVTTQEVKEEVVPVLQTRQATASALESLPENERTNITFMQEDGVEVPIMGNEQVLSDLFQRAQATPEEERTDWHNSVIDAVNVSLSDQIEEQMQEQAANLNESDVITFQANTLEDIPEEFRDSAMEVGPMEITARKKVLGLPIGKKEVVKRRGKAYQFEVPASYVESNKEVFNTLTQLKREGRTEQAATKSKIFDNTAKSVATVFPELGIKTFKSTEEMKNYSQKFGSLSNQILGGEGGVIIYGNDGKPSEILINEEVADATTLPHEVWHGLLFKAFGENEQLFKKFRDDITKTLTDNGYQEIVDQLNEFSSSPEYVESNKQGEEWLVQLGGLLTASGMTTENLTPKAKTLLEQIKKIFNDLATEITGKPIFLEDATAEDVLDFMVTISDRMSRGEDISSFFRDVEQTAATKGESRLAKQIGRKKKEEYAAKLAKERPDLDAEGLTADTISLIEKFGEENSQDGMGNPKLEKLAVHFISRSTVTLPEDGYKIVEAEKLATKNKVDPFAFSNPLDIMEKYKDTIKEKPIDPDTLKEFTNKVSIPGTDIVVYNVEETREGQAAVRRIIDTHFGKDANPWCIAAKLKGDENMDKAWELWSTKYNKMPKKISFRNGKLSAFQASAIETEEVWWDRRNEPFNGVPSTIQLGDNKKQLISLKEDGEVKEYFNIYRKSKELEEEWTADNVLIVKNAFKDGKKKSEERWYDDGQKKSEYLFDDKGFVEYMVSFYEDGTKSSETIRENNKPQESRQWYENGNLKRDIEFDESGKEVENTSFKEDGELDSKTNTTYHSNGNKNEVSYLNGETNITTVAKYDEKDNIISQTRTDQDGNLIYKEVSQEDGSLLKTLFNKDGSYSESQYNAGGDLDYIVKRDKDGKFISGASYQSGSGRRYNIYSESDIGKVNYAFQKSTTEVGTLQESKQNKTKQDETTRRTEEQKIIAQRDYVGNRNLPELLASIVDRVRSSRGITKSSNARTKRVRGNDVNIIATYGFPPSMLGKIAAFFPKVTSTQKIYEIKDGDVYRDFMIKALKDNPFRSSVTVHSAEDFSKMRLFITEDGSSGLTLTKDGFLGGAFSDPNFNRPNNLAQLMILGIKEGALTAEAFDTVLPDYYANFGMKAVSRTAFNDEYRPMVESGALEDWNYETYKAFNNGRPDVVFMIYDGGSRETIEDRIGQFELYKGYEKNNTKSFDKDNYDAAYLEMEKAAASKFLYDEDVKEDSVKTKFQLSGKAGTLQEVQKIAQRYNVNNQGFAPTQVNEFAMNRELEPFGYSAKRATPDANGRQRGVYILNPKGRFFNPFKGKFQRVDSGAAALKESLKTIPGYDDMIRKSKNIALRKSRRYGANWDSIMNAVMQFVMNSPVYTLANDSQREQMVRDVRAEYGKKEKAAPSPKKVFELKSFTDLFGKIDVKMITMPEIELLNQQMRDLARGAKDAKMSWVAASKLVAKQIKELVIAGKISNRQAASVISRLAMVNMFNQNSVDKFTEYMTKVFSDANYDMKIEKARKKLPRALKNIKSKIGVANAVAPSLFELFSINPNLIPDSVLERYIELVDMFGSSDSVLKLDEVSIVAGDVKKILDVIYKEVAQSEELALRFENFDDKVYDEDGKLDYAKTLAKMIDADALTDVEAEIMRKYKKNILPKVEEPAKTEAEIEEEKKAIIKAIKSTTVNASNLPTRLERDLVKRLVELLNPKYLNSLSVNQLENVMKLIDNINNGYMPRYAQITVEKLNSVKKASEDLVPATETAKPLRFSKAVGKTKSLFIKGSSAALEMIRRTPLAYIDQIFGDFNNKRIFNAVFDMMAKGHAAFETDMNKVNKKLDDAHQAVAKSHGNNPNETLEASFRMMAYMIQLEYESNPGSDQVNPAARFIEATINKIYDGKSKYKEADAALLENILDEYGVNVGTDKKGNPIREIDNKKLFKSFNKAERSALEAIRELNEGLTEKAQYTASIIRGESITPLNNYVHLPVMHDYNPNERSTGIQNSEAYNNSRKPSTKAKTLEGRSGDVSAINFDAFASAQKGAKATLLDFHLTEPIRTSRKTINEAREMLKKSGKFKGQNRELINAIESANEEVIRNVLTNNFITDTDVEAVVNEVSKQGYRAILASTERFTSELASNVAFAMISDPKSFATGTKYKSVIMSPMAVDIMFNVGSKQTKRLFSADNLSGRFIDTSILGQASGVKSVTSKNALSNVSQIIYNNSLKKFKNGVEVVADALISTPDKLVMRPIWFGAFANEFKNQTGVEIDFNKIAENDEAYINKYSEAISKARNFADEKSVLAGASDNPFMGIIKGANTADQGYIKRAYNNFNNFMTRFAIYEFAAARQGIYAAMGNGTLTKRQGYALLAGVATRMTTYTLLTQVLGGVVLSMFGIEDEDEETEKSFMQKFGQALASTATSLIVGRDFGNAVKTISNFGVEKVNEEFFTALRNGEYDPFTDKISYSSIPRATPGNPVDLGDIALMFTGSFTPLAKTINLGIDKAFEEAKKEPAAIERQKNEILIRFPLEVLGNMGLIPMYKDVKNVVLGKIYEDLKKEVKAEKQAEKERAVEKEKLGIYESRSDMKKYNPNLYEKTFGPGSPGYDADQEKKKLAKEKSEAKEAAKDTYFGYEETEAERIDREDRERIQAIKESPGYDPNAVPTKDLLTRSELKTYFPDEYKRKYGEGSEYYKEKEPEKKEDKLARDKRKAMLDAAYGKSNSKMGGSKLGGGKLSSDKIGGGKMGGSKLGGGK